VPAKPFAPVYISSDSTSIDLQFIAAENNGGSQITSFELYIDTIQSAASYDLIYSGTDLTTTISTADGLVTGTTYRFVLKSLN